MIELADIATLAFIVSGVTYQGVKYWRSDKRVRLKRELPVSLILRETVVPESITHAVVVVFDRRGCLVRKFPEKEIIRRKKYCKLPCSSAEGMMNFCVSMLYGAQVQTMMPKLHSTNFEGMELIRHERIDETAF